MNQPKAPTPSATPQLATPAKTGQSSDASPTNPSPHSSFAEVQQILHTGAAQVSRFTVLRPHAQGGLGEVLIAADAELGREVAFKRLKPIRATDAAARRRFLVEAAITAKLEHPGIVPIYGLVHDEQGQPCYAMRFIQGESLQEAIKNWHAGEPAASAAGLGSMPAQQAHSAAYAAGSPRFDSLPFRQLLQRFISVCQTMAYAHNKGVIHRDLKPANVMLGPYGETLVVDWGLAKELSIADGRLPNEESDSGNRQSAIENRQSDEGTRLGQALGTPAYMPPEQASGRLAEVGPASDIFGLGAILYELLTGQRPIQGQDAFEQLEKAQCADFPRPRKWQSNVPRPLEAVCLKAMAAQAEDRYASAAELAADVEHWLADEPVSAWREPWSARLRRWGRKHRTLVAMSAALVAVAVLLLTVLTIVVTGKNADLERAYAQAVAAKDRARQTIEVAASDEALETLRQQKKELSPEQRRFLREIFAYYRDYAQEAPTTVDERRRQAQAYFRMAVMLETLGPATEGEAAYRQAATLYEALAAETAEPQDRRGAAQSHNKLGALCRELGRREDAKREYDLAIPAFRQLAKEFPAEPQFRVDLGAMLNNLGVVYGQLRQLPQAESAYGEALAVRQELADMLPNVPDRQRDLAITHNNRAVLYNDRLQRHDDAAADYRRAIAIYQRVVSATGPISPRYRLELAFAYDNLGNTLRALQRRTEAVTEHRHALNLFQELVSDYPTVVRYAIHLGGCYCNNGNCCAENNEQLPEAMNYYARGIATLEAVLHQHPEQGDARQFLCNTYWVRAEAQSKLGHFAEGAADYAKAAELDNGPERPFLRRQRAALLVRAGDLVTGITEADALAQAKNNTGDDLRDLARVYAFAAVMVKADAKLQDQYAGRAVELLRQAVAKGYKDIENLKKDDDLKALRSRADYRQLLEELGKK